jgi:hypothetical protein
MPSWIEAPTPPEQAGATSRLHLRFEDISQDGQVLLEVMPHALGAAVWRPRVAQDPDVQACMAQGIIPILSRYVIEGTAGPFDLMSPVQATGRHALAETEDGRVVVNMWADLEAPTLGRLAPAGRVFGEHTMTRLFAAPDKRRVRRADLPTSIGPLPRHEPRPVAAEEGMTPDDVPVVFGLVHTDSNKHVNSLVYLRLFEEAVLRRLGASARTLISRRIEIVYRKPCFAGDRMRVHTKTLEQEGNPAALVAMAPDGAPVSAAHCVARIQFG